MSLSLKKADAITPYEPIIGEYSIRLDANESPFNLSPEILDEVLAEISKIEFNRYPDPYAKELCRDFAKLNNIDPENVVAGNGSDELISIIISGFLKKGDKVMFSNPDFSMYQFYATLSEMECIKLQKDTDLKLNTAMLIMLAKSEQPDMLLFSNPCNPTGQGLLASEVMEIANTLENTIVVVDEAYMDFWDQSIIEKVVKLNNVILLKTLSKAIGLAGIRVGFMISNRYYIDALKKVKSPYNVNSVSQSIGRVILKNDALLKKNCEQIKNNRIELEKKLQEVLTDVYIFPCVANFVTIRTDDASKIFEYLLTRGIVIRQLSNKLLRITTGTENENSALLNALNELQYGK